MNEAVHQTHPSFIMLFAFGGLAWWTLVEIGRALATQAPPWNVLPPLLFSLAALWDARAGRKAPPR